MFMCVLVVTLDTITVPLAPHTALDKINLLLNHYNQELQTAILDTSFYCL